MDSAIRYIEKDDAFFLHRINCLDLYLKCGITTFVENFGPNFHDMTLIQYAIAKRKPKTLKDMLDTSYYQCQVPFDKIITPETSNTKGNLLSLAIEFGSKNGDYGDEYNEVDIECLKVIIEFANKLKNKNENFNIDIENINGETPLIVAINHQNTEACKLLIENGANILHKCNDMLKSPLLCLLKKAGDLNILINIIDPEFLDANTYEEVYDFCKKIHSGQLEDINNLITTEFLNKSLKQPLPPPEPLLDTPPQPQPPQPPIQNTLICFKCEEKLNDENKKYCKDCQKYFCAKCIANHGC